MTDGERISSLEQLAKIAAKLIGSGIGLKLVFETGGWFLRSINGAATYNYAVELSVGEKLLQYGIQTIPVGAVVLIVTYLGYRLLSISVKKEEKEKNPWD